MPLKDRNVTLMESTGLFERIFARERESRVAILYEHHEISYGALAEQVRTVAEQLRKSGVSEGDRVAILLADSPEFIASFIAIVSIGAVAAPINLALASDAQVFILRDCGACAAIVEASRASLLTENATTLTSLEKVFVVRRESGDEVPEVAGIGIEHLVSSLPSEHASPFSHHVDLLSDAFILYTSGSTGEPKGAVHSQADILYTNETYCGEVLGLSDGDRLFSSSRLPFAYGFGNSLTFPLLNGFTSILCREKPTAEIVARVFAEYQPTIFFGVPVVFRMLLEHHRAASQGPLPTASLRWCISAGEALPAHLGQEWEDTFGVPLLDGIGSTEMLHMFMSNHAGDLRYGSSGKLLRGYEARLLDHQGLPTPAGEIGNLWIRGDSAASRYWQRPDTSARTFVDGWVRTGDLYRCDEDGFWWHTGRSDDCFKATGQWVSPIEVEAVLLKSGVVRAAAVVEGVDNDGLACACAFIVTAGQEAVEDVEQQLRAACDAALPRFKQPRRYIFRPELPYTATGKLQRFKLREELRTPQAQSEQ